MELANIFASVFLNTRNLIVAGVRVTIWPNTKTNRWIPVRSMSGLAVIDYDVIVIWCLKDQCIECIAITEISVFRALCSLLREHVNIIISFIIIIITQLVVHRRVIISCCKSARWRGLEMSASVHWAWQVHRHRAHTASVIVVVVVVDINECASMPCFNNGTCIDEINGYKCNCTVGFSGDRCDNS